MNRESSPIPSASSSTAQNLDVKSTASSSSKPSRILCFKNNSWVDVDREVFDELSQGFIQNKPVLQLAINGKDCVFDFGYLLMMDLSTETETSIGWIDKKGQCYFPKVVVEEKRTRFFGSAELLASEDKFYMVVETTFLNGMRRVGESNASITRIRKCLYSGRSGSLRLGKFNLMMEMTKAMRGGDGNGCFGWYGSTADEVARVVKHGFGRSNEGELGFYGDAHGVGVHLSSRHFPYKSSLLCEPDECDEKHMLLCRVIMGRPEKIEAGSLQEHPSTNEFDSGVDDLTNPTWYIIWNTHMNTHILPQYIVTFKAQTKPAPLRSPSAPLMVPSNPAPLRSPNPAPLRSSRAPLMAPSNPAPLRSPRAPLMAPSNPVPLRSPNPAPLRSPRAPLMAPSNPAPLRSPRAPLMAPGIPVSRLLMEMGRSLPNWKTQALDVNYRKLREGNMSKEDFIRQVKTLAGDELISSTIRIITGY